VAAGVNVDQLIIPYPDDFHMHLRDGAFLQRTVADAAMHFQRVLVMPNLNPPITTVEQAKHYQMRIQAAVPKGKVFTPLMSLYLTEQTTPEFGITCLHKLETTFAAMAEVDLPLLIHGEVTDASIDIFDREAIFIEKVLAPLMEKFPRLRMVLEHITTMDAVQFVLTGPKTIAATITAHHLWVTRNDMLVGGIHPHLYCLPVPKRKKHQQALRDAAISGNPKFFLGTDSAPHTQSTKESACGCAGIYTGFSALPLYVQIFEKMGALARFEDFACVFGAHFYQLPPNTDKVHLIRQKQEIPQFLTFGSERLIPFKAGERLEWSFHP
jgi:dihydroorotase